MLMVRALWARFRPGDSMASQVKVRVNKSRDSPAKIRLVASRDIKLRLE